MGCCFTASFTEYYSKAKNTETSEIHILVWTEYDTWLSLPINISTSFEYSLVIKGSNDLYVPNTEQLAKSIRDKKNKA